VQAGRVDEALKVLKGPGRPEKFYLNWYPLSLALSKNGDTTAAADAFSRAAALVATYRLLSPMPWDEADEARMLVQIGKLEQGEKALVRTLARNPGDHEALVAQALLHARRGEDKEALRALEEAGRRNPFAVVETARDPFFAPLARSLWLGPLLARATSEWEAQLLTIRRRPGIAQSGP
jgi:tetratricopeptide (TPR) repeat protein